MKILVVDDEKLNRLVIVRLLEGAGYECDVVETGEEALDRVAETRYDAILMDNLLPGIDGVETTRQIRARTDLEQPLIFGFSGYIDAARTRDSLSAGMDAILEKPLSLDALSAAIKRHRAP
ncbi:MAG: response regulator [Alkalispirochaeta sp.]